jgi:hypothetical protein
MAEVLKEHIRQCPKHPLAKAEQRIKELEEAGREYTERTDKAHDQLRQRIEELEEVAGD